MHRKNIFMLIPAMILILSCAAEADGHYENARSLALGKSFTALARNYQSLGVNPANLALPGSNGLGLELFTVGANINNNAFSLADYNTYNGEHLSPADKDKILSKIPEQGLEGNIESVVSALAFSKGSIAFGVTGSGDGRAAIDKQVLELILNGNTIGDSIAISRACGSGVAHVDFNLSYGAHLKETEWGRINWGINIKYLYGLAFAEIEEAEAYLVTRLEGVDSRGAVQIKTSEGGSGFGLDLGFSAEYGENWIFSLAVTNLISTIRWNKNNELNTYYFTWTGLTVENSDKDSLITSDEIKESIDSFSESLAPQLALGICTRFKSLLVSFDYKQGFKDQGAVSSTPEVALGCEAGFLKLLPLRAGFSLGGSEGSSAGVGFGLNLKPFFIDFAYMSSGSLIPIGGKGMGLAVSSGLLF